MGTLRKKIALGVDAKAAWSMEEGG